jgi:hypothetical protein
LLVFGLHVLVDIDIDIDVGVPDLVLDLVAGSRHVIADVRRDIFRRVRDIGDRVLRGILIILDGHGIVVLADIAAGEDQQQ